MTKINWNQLASEQVNPKMKRKFIHGEKVMIAKMEFEDGFIVPSVIVGRPVFGNTTSNQVAFGAGPNSLFPFSFTVGLSYTINLSNVVRRINSVFK